MLLSVGAQAGLSALAYPRQKDLRPHTDWRKEGILEFSLLLTLHSSERALFPAIVKRNLNNINTVNTYIVTCQQFFVIGFHHFYLIRILVSAMFVLVETTPPESKLYSVFEYKLVNCYSCQSEVISPNLPHVF